MIRYKTIQTIQGPLVFVNMVRDVSYQEIVTITDGNGKVYKGQVICLDRDVAIVQLFSNSAGFQPAGAVASFDGETKKMALSPTILGRIFNGLGEPIDSLPSLESNAKSTENKDLNFQLTGDYIDYKKSVLPFVYRDINGMAINPYRRREPEDFIQTGISTIDLPNTIVKGQKIPIFSGSGLPDLQLLTQIAAQARTRDPQEKFAVVIATMGISNDDYQFLLEELEKTKALERSVLFVNLASDPVIERIMTPRLALTVAEYFAFDLDYSVLCLTFDLTNYANALREISSAKGEIPGRSGYPSYLYTDLATLLERAGVLEGKVGSLTQIPILTMPNDDKTSVVPDLTGYITEGQIVLDRELSKQFYPGIDILSSLSRLKNNAQKKTREDHPALSDQIFACLAEAKYQEDLALVLGKDSLTETGKKYLEFKEKYNQLFLNQGRTNRSIEETLDLAWEILDILPREELKKIKDEIYQKYSKKAKVKS